MSIHTLILSSSITDLMTLDNWGKIWFLICSSLLEFRKFIMFFSGSSFCRKKKVLFEWKNLLFNEKVTFDSYVAFCGVESIFFTIGINKIKTMRNNLLMKLKINVSPILFALGKWSGPKLPESQYRLIVLEAADLVWLLH